MPARPKTWNCNCEECSAVGGRTFLQSEKAGHLTRVKAVRQSQTEPAVTPVAGVAQPQNREPEDDITELSARLATLSIETPGAEEVTTELATQLFALTMTDEGPDINNQPSKLWTSRDEFQANRRIHALNLTLPLVQDVMDSITRLVTAPSSASSAPVSEPSLQPTRKVVRLPKRERNRATSKALDHLQNIELRTCAAIEKLSEPLSDEVLHIVESELVCLRQAFNKVTRHSALVSDRKQQVVSNLNDLEARVMGYKARGPSTQEPIHYNSGK